MRTKLRSESVDPYRLRLKLTMRPVSLIELLMWFGIPGSAILIGIQWINPILVNAGVPLIFSFMVLLYGPILAVGVAAMVACRREGHSANWSAFTDRMRLGRMSRLNWTYTLLGLIFALAFEALFAAYGGWLAQLPLFSPPDSIPSLFDPAKEMILPPIEFMDVPLAGAWWVAVVFLVALIINIFGEEIAWRGYLLPRMEVSYPKFAWLINGLLWIFVLHVGLRWLYVGLLPTGLITPFVAKLTRNACSAIIIHGFGNIVFLALIMWGTWG